MVYPTYSTDRVCSDVRGLPLPAANLDVSSGSGFIVGSVAVNGNGQSQATFGGFLNGAVGSSSAVTSILGSVQSSGSTSVQSSAAASIDATLVTQNGVWFDAPTISVAIRVHDDSFNVQCSSVSIQVSVSPVSFSSSIIVGSCTPSTTTGYCLVSLSANSSWFSTGRDETVDVSYNIALSGSSTSLGSVMIHTTPRSSNYTGVFVSLPLRDLYVGNTFTASVYAFAGVFSINTFRMKISTDVGQISINSINVNGAVWASSILSSSVNEYVISASPAAPLSRSVTASAPELIFQISMSVIGLASIGQATVMNCSVFDLYDSKGVAVYSQFPSPATFGDRFSTNSSSGRVFVANNSVIAILPFVGQSEFFNTAVIDGTQVQSLLTVVGIRPDGTSVTLASGVTCTSSNTSIVQVSITCASVYLNGSEVAGSARVLVNVASGSLQLSIAIRVWFPDFPLTWSVSDNVLNAVMNWFDSTNSCAQRYQSSSLKIMATFRTNSTSQVTVDVTRYGRASFQSSNSSVAQIKIINGAANVVGLAVGLAEISLNNWRSSQLGSVSLSVDANTVMCMYLGATVVESTTLSGVPAQVGRSGSFVATVTINQILVRESQSAYVHVMAAFSDGTAQAITVSDGLQLISVNTNILRVSGQNIVATGSGNGLNVEAKWLSGVCNNVTLGDTLSQVNISLPVPTSAEITVSTSRITLSSDSAAQLGIATQAMVTVNLVFADGRRQDVTNDSRTVYDDAALDTNNVIQLMRQANGLPYIVGTTKAGTGSLFVSFTHVSVNVSVAFLVVVVSNASIATSPYPSFGTSDSVNDADLNLIGESGVYQQLYVRFTVKFSDGTTSRVDTNALSSYQVYQVDTTTPVATTVVVGGSVPKNVIGRKSGAPDGAVDIVGTFNSVIVSNAVTVRVNSTKVVVVSFSSISFPSSLVGVINATFQPTFAASFSDNSQWTTANLFSGSNIVLPNLVSFSTSNGAVASVNNASGLVTLVDNDNVVNTLTLMAVDAGQFQQSVSFSANLAASVGDIDVGAASGVPVPSVAVGNTFSVIVRANLGTSTLRSVQLATTYDASRLQIVSVVQGS
jgi:hypothetical protein